MALMIDYATRPMPGETVCGDLCGWWSGSNGRIVLALADGLGHGREAAVAARAALASLAGHLDASCEEMFAVCDTELKSLRGAALAIAIVELATNRVTVSSVGNVRCLLLNRERIYRFPLTPGIVGAGYHKIISSNLDLVDDDLLLFYSDGIDERISLPDSYTPDTPLQSLSQGLLDRWARHNDDASVLLYRHLCMDGG